MSYSILSSNLVLGLESVPQYSFRTPPDGILQVERLDGNISVVDIDGRVKCDTLQFNAPTRNRMIHSDEFGRLGESNVVITTFEEWFAGNVTTDNVTANSVSIGSTVSAPTGYIQNTIGNTATYTQTVSAPVSYIGVSTGNSVSLDGTISASNTTLTGNLTAINGFFSGDLFIAASDRRLKTDIHPLNNALETIKKIKGYTFSWKPDIPGLHLSGQDIGLIAQEVQATSIGDRIVAPAPFDRGLNGTSKSGENYLTIKYDKLHALEIQSIHEIVEKIEALEKRLDALEAP